jgi:hypothetical protein
MKPVNRLAVVPEVCDLLPTTKLDRLLSEEDRKLFAPRALPRPAQTLREAINHVGRLVRGTKPHDWLYREYYPMFYRMARAQLPAGVSRDDLEALLSPLADRDDELVAVVRQAIEDGGAGKPPKYKW